MRATASTADPESTPWTAAAARTPVSTARPTRGARRSSPLTWRQEGPRLRALLLLDLQNCGAQAPVLPPCYPGFGVRSCVPTNLFAPCGFARLQDLTPVVDSTEAASDASSIGLVRFARPMSELG